MIYVDAIFFDVDGTLVDSSIDIIAGINFTLKKFGLKEKPGDEIMSYVGAGVRYLVGRSLGAENASKADEGLKLFSDYYVKHADDNAKLYPHVREVLEYFKGKKKFILTNRYEAFAEATLKGMSIKKYFEGIIGGDDETCLKPSVCIMDDFLRRVKVDKDKAVIVGDMDVDVMAGKKAGIRSCWVTYGLGKEEDVRPLGPDYVIDDLIELESIIE